MRLFLMSACVAGLTMSVSPSRAASDQPPDSTQVTSRPVVYTALPPINSRLRINAEIPSPHFWDYFRKKPFTGTLTAIHSDSLIISSSMFQLASIKRMDVSQGKQHARLEGAVLGLVGGAVAGAAILLLGAGFQAISVNNCSSADECPTDTLSESEMWQVTGAFAVAGAIAGAIFYKKEAWREWTPASSGSQNQR